VPDQNLPEQNPNQPRASSPEDHLSHLLPSTDLEKPWFLTIFDNVKDLINPPRLPPLEVTSKPVPIGELGIFAGSTYEGNKATSGITSLIIHGGVVGLLFLISTFKPVQDIVKKQLGDSVVLAPYISKVQKQASGGGGGGGARQVLQASKGKLPKPAPRVFTPPRVDPLPDPKLPMAPSIIAPDDVPNIQANNYGDPLSKLGIPSNGTGFGGGIGSGSGGGVGSGKGNGVGPGEGGGFGGGVYRIGGGVSQPVPIFRPEPEYSEEARKAKWQGEVGLRVIIDANGTPVDIRVTRSLGLGLDEKAIEAVTKWRFKPAMKDGKPVAVSANIVVNFRLL